MAKQYEATIYAGGNEYLDPLIEDGQTIWRVQGPIGLLPLLADSEEEALKIYKRMEADR